MCITYINIYIKNLFKSIETLEDLQKHRTETERGGNEEGWRRSWVPDFQVRSLSTLKHITFSCDLTKCKLCYHCSQKTLCHVIFHIFVCFIHFPYFCNFLETLIFHITWFDVKSLVMTSHEVLVNLWFIWFVKTFCHSVEDDFLVVFWNEKLNFQMKSTLDLKWHFVLQELNFFKSISPPKFHICFSDSIQICKQIFNINFLPPWWLSWSLWQMHNVFTVLCSWYSSCDFMVTYLFRVYHQLLLMVFMKILTGFTWQAERDKCRSGS